MSTVRLIVLLQGVSTVRWSSLVDANNMFLQAIPEKCEYSF